MPTRLPALPDANFSSLVRPAPKAQLLACGAHAAGSFHRTLATVARQGQWPINNASFVDGATLSKPALPARTVASQATDANQTAFDQASIARPADDAASSELFRKDTAPSRHADDRVGDGIGRAQNSTQDEQVLRDTNLDSVVETQGNHQGEASLAREDETADAGTIDSGDEAPTLDEQLTAATGAPDASSDGEDNAATVQNVEATIQAANAIVPAEELRAIAAPMNAQAETVAPDAGPAQPAAGLPAPPEPINTIDAPRHVINPRATTISPHAAQHPEESALPESVPESKIEPQSVARQAAQLNEQNQADPVRAESARPQNTVSPVPAPQAPNQPGVNVDSRHPAPSNAPPESAGQSQAESNDGNTAGGRQRPGAARAEGEATPAAARAAQVEAAIRLENATAMRAEPDQSVRPSSNPVIASASGGNVASRSLDETAQPQQLPPAGADLDAEPLAARIVRGLSTMVNQRGGAMTMRLDPPDLGQLRIQMTIFRGVVNARFEVATEQARALLDKSLAVLRGALESHGLTVERLAVQTAAPATYPGLTRHDANDQPQHHQQQGQQRNDPDAAGGQSRGRQDADPQSGWRGRSDSQRDRSSFAQRLYPLTSPANSAAPGAHSWR